MSILYFRKINWRLKNTDIFTIRMVPRNFGLCKNSGSFSRKFKYLILTFKVSAKSIKHRCKKNFYCNSFFFTTPSLFVQIYLCWSLPEIWNFVYLVCITNQTRVQLNVWWIDWVWINQIFEFRILIFSTTKDICTQIIRFLMSQWVIFNESLTDHQKTEFHFVFLEIWSLI